VKRRAGVAIVLAAVVSAAIWASSLWVTGHREPWDAESLFYAGSLAAGGLISGLSIPRPLWAHYAGSVAGQVIYELIFLPMGPFFVLGLGFLPGYSLLYLAGALVGSRVRLHLDPRA